MTVTAGKAAAWLQGDTVARPRSSSQRKRPLAEGSDSEEAIKELGATSPKEMGAVMKAVMAKTSGQADNKIVSELVKKNLYPIHYSIEW